MSNSVKYAKRFTAISLVLFASVSLTACTPTESNSVKESLSGTKIEQTQDQPSPTPTMEEADNDQIKEASELNKNQIGKNSNMPEYKTIEDFKQIDATHVTLTTTKGDIVVELFRDKAPLTTANFLDLVASGFYDEIIFHRVIEDFMAQVGDPLTKDPSKEAMWGTGGPGYKIEDEFDDSLRHDGPGVLSMANSGPNTGGSQIFITHVATPWLDGKHAVFGKVSQGLDILMKIEQGDKIISVSYK